jgi:tetratricopeptide (TPR) repeat protein
MMIEASLRERTIALIRRARRWEREAVAALSAEQRDAPSSIDKWNAKDKLVHVNLWKADEAQNLRDALNGTTPDARDDFQGYNDRMYEQYRAASWQEVERFSNEATEALISAIESYGEDALAVPDANGWFNGRTPSEFAANGVVWHGLMHMSEAYIERGDGEGAMVMFDDVMPHALALTPGERGQGTAKYNLACLYAQLGHTDEALDLLEEGFGLRPDLKEFSRQDSDLKNLWALERYEALAAGATSEPA